MNLRLITIIIFILASILASGNNTGTTQAQFDKIIVQKAEDDRLTQIPGEPEALILEVMSRKEYIPNYDDYKYGNPFFPNMYSSYNIIILGFDTSTTVFQANTILTEVNAEIVGATPGVANRFGGLVYIRVPTVSFEELDAMIEELDSKPEVLDASFDVGLSTPTPIPGDGSITPQTLPRIMSVYYPVNQSREVVM